MFMPLAPARMRSRTLNSIRRPCQMHIPPGMQPISHVRHIPDSLKEQINIDWYLATNVHTTSLAPPSRIQQVLASGWPPAIVGLRLLPADVTEAHSVIKSKGQTVRVQNYVLRDGEFLWRRSRADPSNKFEDTTFDEEIETPPAFIWCSYDASTASPKPRFCDAITQDVAWKFTFEDDGIKAYFDSYTLTFGHQGVLRDGEAIEGHVGGARASVHSRGSL